MWPPATDLQLRPFYKSPSLPRSHPRPTSRSFPALFGERVASPKSPGSGLEAPRASAPSRLGARGKWRGQKGVAFSLPRERGCCARAWENDDQLRPRAARRPSARTKRRGPRTRLSLQALRTRPNPSATSEAATPLSALLPSGPVASMTPLVHARRPHPLLSLVRQPRPRASRGRCPRIAARGRP